MSIQRQSGNGVIDEINQAADKLFRTFLEEFTLSKDDRDRREAVLVELPTHLKEAIQGQVDNVVLFPFGTFYHGIGFRDDPLTVYVTTGHLVTSMPDGKKEMKTTPSSKGRGHDNSSSSGNNGDSDSSSSDDGDYDDDYSSTGSIHSTDSEDAQTDNSRRKIMIISASEEEKSTRDDNRMRQALLLNINDVLIKPENYLGQVYMNVTLTSQGKLYFTYRQLGYFTSPETTGHQAVACYLQAKSFLPVQMSRLVKFFCLLDQLFWPFAQLVLNWTKNYGILEHEEKAGTDGLKQDHVLSLVIFFLVRKRIIPSFELLQQWSTSQLIILNEGEKVNVGFCEDMETVRENCLKMGIGTGSEEWTLERILQLVYEFFYEMSTFDFGSCGLQIASGKSFCKRAATAGRPPHIQEFGKRTLYRNTPMCIQHVLDEFANSTRKVNESCVLKLRTRCKDAADRLISSLWAGDLLNAVLGVLDAENASGYAPTTTKSLTNWEDRCAYQVNCMEPQRRCINFRVPPRIVQMLKNCFDPSMREQMEVQKEDPFRRFSDPFVYQQGMKTLFKLFIEEFNSIFWQKMVAAYTLQTGSAGDPKLFNFVNPLQCPGHLSKNEKAAHVVTALLNLGSSWDNASTEFYAIKDWTRETCNDLFLAVNKSKVKDLVDSFLMGVKRPRILYGQRPGSPIEYQIMAVVKLDIKYAVNEGITVETLVRTQCNAPELHHYLDWYNALIKPFVIKRFIRWMGSSVVNELEENCANILKKKLENKKKLASTDKMGKTVPRSSSTTPASTVSVPGGRSVSYPENSSIDFYTERGNQFSRSISASSNAVMSRVVKVSNESATRNPCGIHPSMASPSMTPSTHYAAGRGRGRRPGRGGRGASAQFQHVMRFGRGNSFGNMASYRKHPY